MTRYCPDCSTQLPAAYKKCPACDHPAALVPGTPLAGKYEILNVLGAGAFGIVYRAKVTAVHGTLQPNDLVVIKEMLLDPIPANAQNNVLNRDRFELEADLLAKLQLPKIPKGYGKFQEGGHDFMSMQFVPGNNLEQVLKNAPGGKLEQNEVLRVGIEAALVLQTMHEQKLVHRDIKPANFQMAPDNSIWILDLGIAREAQQMATRATVALTMEYASPEHFRQGGVDPDSRADLYSLAASLFELATGKPFVGTFPQRLNEVNALPSSWQTAFKKAIAIDRDQRQSSVLHFAHELNALLPAQLKHQLPSVPSRTRIVPPVVAPPATVPPPASPPRTVTPSSATQTRIKIQPTVTPQAPILPPLSPSWQQRMGPKLGNVYNVARWLWNTVAPSLGATPLATTNPSAITPTHPVPTATPVATTPLTLRERLDDYIWEHKFSLQLVRLLLVAIFCGFLIITGLRSNSNLTWTSGIVTFPLLAVGGQGKVRTILALLFTVFFGGLWLMFWFVSKPGS